MLTEDIMSSYKLKISLSLTKREVGVSSNPFTNFGKDAVDKLFTEEDVNELVQLVGKLTA
ncbi:MAG: hypothetical protein DAHOPDDO_03520 [Ignavibacteriaceae bacterium]|nr:hypothetical protein [Ignavibacteriaceae bacterium]